MLNELIGVAKERNGFRDEAISRRHREWGMMCHAVDLDFVLVECIYGKPAALIEYKHYLAKLPNLNAPTYRALKTLADNTQIPFLLVFYWPGVWSFKVFPANDHARAVFPGVTQMTELQFVGKLYALRNAKLPGCVGKDLATTLPEDELIPF